MKNTKFISCILIFVGTIVFSTCWLANAILTSAALQTEAVVNMSNASSWIEGFAIVVLFAGIVTLVTEFVLEVKNKNKA